MSPWKKKWDVMKYAKYYIMNLLDPLFLQKFMQDKIICCNSKHSLNSARSSVKCFHCCWRSYLCLRSLFCYSVKFSICVFCLVCVILGFKNYWKIFSETFQGSFWYWPRRHKNGKNHTSHSLQGLCFLVLFTHVLSACSFMFLYFLRTILYVLISFVLFCTVLSILMFLVLLWWWLH